MHVEMVKHYNLFQRDERYFCISAILKNAVILSESF